MPSFAFSSGPDWTLWQADSPPGLMLDPCSKQIHCDRLNFFFLTKMTKQLIFLLSLKMKSCVLTWFLSIDGGFFWSWLPKLFDVHLLESYRRAM